MGVFKAIAQFVGGCVTLGCVVASCYFAFQFGKTRGDGDAQAALFFGCSAAAFDLFKCILPLLISDTAARVQKTAGWIGFVLLTGFSMWCAYGLNSVQIADRVSTKAAASKSLTEAETALNRLRSERDKVPSFIPTSQDQVSAAEDAVKLAADQRSAECDAKRGGRGINCRAREADERAAQDKLTTAQGNLALTRQAKLLDDRIADAEKAVAGVDVKAAVKDADPQSKSMAKLAHVGVEFIQLVSGMWWAICIEIGSGIGLWLVFHSVPVLRPQPQSARPPSPADSAAPNLTVTDLKPVAPTPEQIRARFFKECVLPITGQRVKADILYVAYSRWCSDNNFQPMTNNAFGRDPPWLKSKTGGHVWYHGAQLIGAYAEQVRPHLVSSNHQHRALGAMATVGRA